MHRFYVEECKHENVPFAKYPMYEKMFNTQFNIAFFRPRKHQYSACTQFMNTINEKYDKHLVDKKH